MPTGIVREEMRTVGEGLLGDTGAESCGDPGVVADQGVEVERCEERCLGGVDSLTGGGLGMGTCGSSRESTSSLMKLLRMAFSCRPPLFPLTR